MPKITDEIKQQIPRLVGNEVKELIRKNIDNKKSHKLQSHQVTGKERAEVGSLRD